MKIKLDRDGGHESPEGRYWIATLEDPIVGGRDIRVHVPIETIFRLQRAAAGMAMGGDWVWDQIEKVAGRVADERPSRFDMYLTDDDLARL